MLGGDLDRARRATSAIAGPDVTHYWDPRAVTGGWAEEHLPWPNSYGPAWDVFYRFDGDATWGDKPGPVLATGYTIVARRDDLAAGLEQLLG